LRPTFFFRRFVIMANTSVPMLKALRVYLCKACDEEDLSRLLFDTLNGFDYKGSAGSGTQYETRVFTVLLRLDQVGGVPMITKIAQESIHEFGNRPGVEELRKALEAFLPAAQPGPSPAPPPADPAAGPPSVPAGVPVKLPPELDQVLGLYNPSPETIWLVANKLRSQFEKGVPNVLDPPHLFHLSAWERHRLAAVLALERSPEMTYVWWLAERVTIEQPVIGFLAAKALTSAAFHLERPELPHLRSAANAALDRLADMMNAATHPPAVPLHSAQALREEDLVEYDPFARKLEVSAALDLIDMRTVPRSRLFLSPDDLEKFLKELIRTFQRPALEQLCQAVDLPLKRLARDDDPIEHCVVYLVIRARSGQWERDLIKAALAARPDNNTFNSIQQTNDSGKIGA
jgi:hypothetical protein